MLRILGLALFLVIKQKVCAEVVNDMKMATKDILQEFEKQLDGITLTGKQEAIGIRARVKDALKTIKKQADDAAHIDHIEGIGIAVWNLYSEIKTLPDGGWSLGGWSWAMKVDWIKKKIDEWVRLEQTNEELRLRGLLGESEQSEQSSSFWKKPLTWSATEKCCSCSCAAKKDIKEEENDIISLLLATSENENSNVIGDENPEVAIKNQEELFELLFDEADKKRREELEAKRQRQAAEADETNVIGR